MREKWLKYAEAEEKLERKREKAGLQANEEMVEDESSSTQVGIDIVGRQNIGQVHEIETEKESLIKQSLLLSIDCSMKSRISNRHRCRYQHFNLNARTVGLLK